MKQAPPGASATGALPHRRRNALTGDWVLVSPHRTQRPWQGRHEPEAGAARPAYDPSCYLCPGNERANGDRNPPYEHTYVFENDFAALLRELGEDAASDPLFEARAVRGTCRVICFSPRHDLTLARMPEGGLIDVIQEWMRQTAELGKSWKWVQVFENKGAIMGCSNPHPHGQVWASDSLPHEIAKEDREQRIYFETHGEPLLTAYGRREADRKERVVAENDEWLCVVPYWAVWPFETLLLPRSRVTRLPELSESQQSGLAQILQSLLIRYDNLFSTSFPYSMGWHGAPFSEGDQEHWQLHAHFYPPLLRSSTVKKFMVGYEMLAEPQRDLTPEAAAERLRACSTVHYLGA